MPKRQDRYPESRTGRCQVCCRPVPGRRVYCFPEDGRKISLCQELAKVQARHIHLVQLFRATGRRVVGVEMASWQELMAMANQQRADDHNQRSKSGKYTKKGN